MDIFYS